MKNLSTDMRATAFVLIAFLGFNIADAFVKEAYNHYYFANAALYPMVSFCVLALIFSKKLGGLKSTIQSKNKKLHLLRAIAGTTGYVCFIYALQTITLAEAYTLFLTSPFWVSILSILAFKSSFKWHRWAAIIIGFIGVLIVLRPGLIPLETTSLIVLFAALCISIYIILTKKIGEQEPLINLVLFPILTDIILFAIILTVQNEWALPQIEHFYLFGIAGLFYFGSMILSSIGYSTGESSILAPLHYSQILWGVLIGYFFFSETPEIWTLVGAITIVLSGIYMIHREHINSKL
jgi:S-adenosylmethionine uptake transporter